MRILQNEENYAGPLPVLRGKIMPFISHAEVAKIENTLAKEENRKDRDRAMKKRAKEKAIMAAEAVGAATVVGAIRGKLEAGGTQFVVPGTDLDGQMILGAGLMVAGTLKAFGKHSDDFFNAGIGIMASYGFTLGRQFGKTGKASLVAGDLQSALSGSGL